MLLSHSPAGYYGRRNRLHCQVFHVDNGNVHPPVALGTHHNGVPHPLGQYLVAAAGAGDQVPGLRYCGHTILTKGIAPTNS